eukprot:CAMPEP_0195536638 /NCGR_PEP_ID=MMETSP0794_2-20130614/46447_1 /TAXON_ID=515487 /ORGANISM="Stephanopyxis turris, Strain CCMP 815" /LENGTH=167 /DNA_ID=CAMNT_0040670119 /DNA_START=454 /DNA_END=957 /DNA_ORIENTATION=+
MPIRLTAVVVVENYAFEKADVAERLGPYIIDPALSVVLQRRREMVPALPDHAHILPRLRHHIVASPSDHLVVQAANFAQKVAPRCTGVAGVPSQTRVDAILRAVHAAQHGEAEASTVQHLPVECTCRYLGQHRFAVQTRVCRVLSFERQHAVRPGKGLGHDVGVEGA